MCVCVRFSLDNTDRVRPAGVLRATALPGLRLAEDQVGGQPADPPHPRRSNEPWYIFLSRISTEKRFIYVLCSACVLLLLFLHLPSSPAAAREVCDERRGWSFFRRVCGDENESSGQVPETSCRPSCPLLQPTSKCFPVCQGKIAKWWEVHFSHLV